METQKRTLNEVNNVYDIINFIKGNTSNIEDVIEEIKKVCISHEILCGSHYSPYPNIECYVL